MEQLGEGSVSAKQAVFAIIIYIYEVLPFFPDLIQCVPEHGKLPIAC